MAHMTCNLSFTQHTVIEFLWDQLRWWNSDCEIKEKMFWGSDTGSAEHSYLSDCVLRVFSFVLKDHSAFSFNVVRPRKNSLGLRYLEKTALFVAPL